jgi:hypothetical protein
MYCTLSYTPFSTDKKIMLDAIIEIWSDVDVMSLRELCGALTAHDACAHEPNASFSPSDCEFEGMPFSYRQCADSFSILASVSHC